MSRTSCLMALAVVFAVAGCSDRTAPEPATESAQVSRDIPSAARERLARRIALALADGAEQGPGLEPCRVRKGARRRRRRFVREARLRLRPR